MSQTLRYLARIVFTPAAGCLLYGNTALHLAPQEMQKSEPAASRISSESRRPENEAETRYWLENMVVFHRFTVAEVKEATGLSEAEINAALAKFSLSEKVTPRQRINEPLRVLPYPGGRHPRIGFLEGAIHPQRETKVSVFTPWDPNAYVVVDVPEAIFSNLGLIYLAHTHIPTVWDEKRISLPRLEWNREATGELSCERPLPNGIVFGTRVMPSTNAVRMELWLRNGTNNKLTNLRVQNCVMLKAAPGFTVQITTNKVFQGPFAAVRAEDSGRWIITAWEPSNRCWGNEKVPCIHADPRFPDCAPGETVRVRGWLSFYEGRDLQAELKRISASDWLKAVRH